MLTYISFFDSSFIYFMINVYLDNQQLALKYLKDTEVNINNILLWLAILTSGIEIGILLTYIIWLIVIYL